MKLTIPRTIPRNLSHRGHALAQRRHFAKPTNDFVTIVEVGPRDGLQNEKTPIELDTKVELVRRLATTGLKTIEAGSFVSPKWTPQMAGSGKILSHLLTSPPPSPVPIKYQWLLPNTKGLELFNEVYAPSQTTSSTSGSAATHEIAIFLAATESFSKRNTNRTIAESIAASKAIFTSARAASIPVRAYISVALGCPFEGPNTDPHKVASMAAELLEMGAYEVSVADTTGMGTVHKTRDLLKTLKSGGIMMEDVAMHFHDTFGQALSNILVSVEEGIRTFDSAVGGLGGCPYSPGATGNVATEDLVYTLHSLGAKTGVDLDEISRIGEWITGQVGKGNESRAGKGTLARLRREEEKRRKAEDEKLKAKL
ncbi:aldolase [Myriangium duriaei CBS 260.36]|uniref:hydroxymethylglutaryl-CoA lyase n=1 Tax=Myriangium duriaei CBS 260.36 TaxID=1168546 RepID=A0A9P4MIG4_9PEZI|nr:aldolase [Myriangium duriaei CBS 260.36]